MIERIKLLNTEELANIRSLTPLLDFSNTDSLHVGQNNTEAVIDHNSVTVAQTAASAFGRHPVRLYCQTNTIENWIISKTEAGQEFLPHHDNPRLGHFSVSLYLSDPESYEGGEICLMPGNEEMKFKPEAGEAVIYDTGVPHRVSRVESGTRIVCIFWIKSACLDPEMRTALGHLLTAHNMMEGGDKWESFEEAKQDPKFMLSLGLSSLLSRHAPGYN